MTLWVGMPNVQKIEQSFARIKLMGPCILKLAGTLSASRIKQSAVKIKLMVVCMTLSVGMPSVHLIEL